MNESNAIFAVDSSINSCFISVKVSDSAGYISFSVDLINKSVLVVSLCLPPAKSAHLNRVLLRTPTKQCGNDRPYYHTRLYTCRNIKADSYCIFRIKDHGFLEFTTCCCIAQRRLKVDAIVANK